MRKPSERTILEMRAGSLAIQKAATNMKLRMMANDLYRRTGCNVDVSVNPYGDIANDWPIRTTTMIEGRFWEWVEPWSGYPSDELVAQLALIGDGKNKE